MCVLSPQCSWLWPVRSDMVERIWTSSGWRFVKTCSWRTSRRFLRFPRRRRAWPVFRSGWLRNWENTPTRSPSRYWAWHTWSESRVCLIYWLIIIYQLDEEAALNTSCQARSPATRFQIYGWRLEMSWQILISRAHWDQKNYSIDFIDCIWTWRNFICDVFYFSSFYYK